jgi:hypothetical protein
MLIYFPTFINEFYFCINLNVYNNYLYIPNIIETENGNINIPRRLHVKNDYGPQRC